jgi:RNA polymerase sigma-70 factor (ECF subfamily)
MPTSHASARSQTEEDGATDAALMARAQTGDVDAFVLLYDRHAPSMLALLQRMLSSASDAEDLLQDVFLEAWQAVRGYDRDRASVRTWFVVRARSRALDRLQRRSREPRPSDEAEPAAGAQGRTAPEGAEQRLTVRRALETLDPAVRETLEYTYYAGMKAAEIAERMGVPVGTVRSRLARGLRVLSGLLADERRTP